MKELITNVLIFDESKTNKKDSACLLISSINSLGSVDVYRINREFPNTRTVSLNIFKWYFLLILHQSLFSACLRGLNEFFRDADANITDLVSIKFSRSLSLKCIRSIHFVALDFCGVAMLKYSDYKYSLSVTSS